MAWTPVRDRGDVLEYQLLKRMKPKLPFLSETTMKIIKKVTNAGIEFSDEIGSEKFVDFKECNEHWIQYRKRTEYLDDAAVDEIKRNDKTIGQRDICATPRFIEFFTYPKFTRFEFDQSIELQDTEKSFIELKKNISSAGWTTIDLS